MNESERDLRFFLPTTLDHIFLFLDSQLKNSSSNLSRKQLTWIFTSLLTQHKYKVKNDAIVLHKKHFSFETGFGEFLSQNLLHTNMKMKKNTSI